MHKPEKTVRDVIAACDLYAVTQNWVNRYKDEWSELPAEQIAEKKQKIEENLNAFRRKLLSLPDAKGEENYIMIAGRYWDFGEESISSNMYRTDEFMEFLDFAAKVEIPPIESVNLDNAKDTVKKLTSEHILTSYGYEFSDWEEILPVRVIPGNVDRVGLNSFAADILWEMSFNGFDEESQSERKEELEKSMQECDEIRQLPEEERAKHYHPVDIDSLYKDLGIEPPTPEEREMESKKMYLDAAKTYIDQIIEFRKIAEELRSV